MPAPKGNQNAKGNKGGGRKSSYQPEFAKWALKMALLGATDEQLADAFDVTGATIRRWRGKYEEFSDALKMGKAFADSNVSSALYHRAIGYSHDEEKIFNNQGEEMRVKTTRHYPPDTTAAIFWLKNRRPDEWRDKQEVEHGVNEDLASRLFNARKRAMDDDGGDHE